MTIDSISCQKQHLLSCRINPFDSVQSYIHLQQLNPTEQQIFRSIQHLQLKAFMKGLPWGDQARREVCNELLNNSRLSLKLSGHHNESFYTFMSDCLNKIEPLYQISDKGGYFKSFKKLDSHMTSCPHSILATDQGDFYEIIHNLTPDVIQNMNDQDVHIDDKKISLGAGIYGHISLGRHIDTGELVALKKFDELDIAEEEAEQYQNIENALGCKEGLVQCKGTALIQQDGIEKGYLVLPLFNLGDGSKNLNASSQTTSAKSYITAVHHLHDLGIAHRDIRLKNFLHSTMLGIALTDFGISQPFHEIIMKFGTPGYLPPEKFKPHFTGIRQDCFALGRVLLELKHQKEDIKALQGHHLEIQGQHIKLEFDAQGECLGVPYIAGFNPREASTYDEVIAGFMAANPLVRLDTSSALNTPYFKSQA
ncbi:MAG: hypothetical protein CMD81_02460 [Gammaproteobacteria bacterium]|nr:hypothetical protein [Gammaproteobacteria bacterium]HBF09181.1 hypothetical protein [Gammaproteobacteria bacterium]|tara:strand:- start:1387 stop:2655 length:1269 start_codon:yes stop_codon:yes gene_type:complete